MAYVDYGEGGGSNPPDSGMGGWINFSDPSFTADPAASNPSYYGTIAGDYKSLLGRDPENNSVVDSWYNGTGGNFDAIYQGIFNSPEAIAYRARPSNAWDPNAPAPGTTSAPAPASGDLMARIQAQLAYAKSSDDPNYWFQKISADPNGAGSAWGYWADRINRGNGAQLGLPLFQDGPAAAPAVATGASPFLSSGTNPGDYSDPSSAIFLNQVLQRLNQVQQPQDHSVLDLLNSLALKRVDALNAPPYSAADEQALITKYREPLTAARDAAYQRNREVASQKGFLPSSGLIRTMDNSVNRGYEQGIAQGSNTMAVNAIQQKQANAEQQLQILSSLIGANNQATDRSNAMSDQAVQLAKMFPDFDAQRLDQMLRASSDPSAATGLSALTSLGGLNLNALNASNANDAANQQAWGKLLAWIISQGGN